MYEEIKLQGTKAVTELLEKTSLQPGDILVIGCSTSEILGEAIGTHSAFEAADALYQGIAPLLKERGIYLAAQCCEHLNRALVLEREATQRYGYEPVCVVPQPKAGGSFATAAYRNCSAPVVVEAIRANAGMDIGDTLIGMHLKAVAVPLRLEQCFIGKARLICAYSRPKLIGGARAAYE